MKPTPAAKATRNDSAAKPAAGQANKPTVFLATRDNSAAKPAAPAKPPAATAKPEAATKPAAAKPAATVAKPAATVTKPAATAAKPTATKPAAATKPTAAKPVAAGKLSTAKSSSAKNKAELSPTAIEMKLKKCFEQNYYAALDDLNTDRKEDYLQQPTNGKVIQTYENLTKKENALIAKSRVTIGAEGKAILRLVMEKFLSDINRLHLPANHTVSSITESCAEQIAGTVAECALYIAHSQLNGEGGFGERLRTDCPDDGQIINYISGDILKNNKTASKPHANELSLSFDYMLKTLALNIAKTSLYLENIVCNHKFLSGHLLMLGFDAVIVDDMMSQIPVKEVKPRTKQSKENSVVEYEDDGAEAEADEGADAEEAADDGEEAADDGEEVADDGGEAADDGEEADGEEADGEEAEADDVDDEENA